jgi:hypothetical protein
VQPRITNQGSPVSLSGNPLLLAAEHCGDLALRIGPVILLGLLIHHLNRCFGRCGFSLI